ncbi:ABC transporter ATP-binding protein [Mesorhizobium sp. CCNWLW179-1]|uniref:ABC transporter ATP-binding protein n=1 Tax=unclassified Mesorhizobium TaxID=325217 RepID=UPI0030149996
MHLLTLVAQKIKPLVSDGAIRTGDTFHRFIWASSGMHQLYVGAVAICVTLLNFVPIELQRRIIDVAVANRDVRTLLLLGALYLSVLILYSGVKYVLMIYQGWVGESAVKSARDQLAVVAAGKLGHAEATGGQTANVIGNEIDGIGGFVGTSISGFVVNASMMIVVFSYMVYVQSTIAFFSAITLIPQFVIVRYLQRRLNALVERQVKLVRKLGDQAVDTSSSAPEMLHAASQTIATIFKNRMEAYLLKFGLKTLLNIANSLGSLAVLIVGGYLVIKGQTTIGTVVAFISGFQRLSDPMGDILDFYRTYSQTKIQYAMILEWVGGTGGLADQGEMPLLAKQ